MALTLTERLQGLVPRIRDVHQWSGLVQGAFVAGTIRLGDYITDPLIVPLGGEGVDGVAPRVLLRDSTDVHRMVHFANERPIVYEWVKVIRSLPNDACVVDIGAGAGGYTLAAASILADGVVVAVEPDPETFERLCTNIKLNQFDRRIMAMPIAIGGSEHPVTLYTNGASGPAPSLRDGKFSGDVLVRMHSLDYLVRRRIIPAPDAIKIDVEGGEAGPDGVFAGMRETLSAGYPHHLFLETHPHKMTSGFGGTTQEILGTLADYGYRKAYRYDRTRDAPIYHFKR